MDKRIRGSSGGGSGHTPVESPNTLRSKTTSRLLMLLSRGEIGGLADQTNKLKSVYLNNVPVQNADGTLNFNGVEIDERFGLPSQGVMAGYPSASATFNVGTKITTAAPVTYTSSTSAADAIRVTVRFPALFEVASNGDTNGTSVQFDIYTKLGTGAFSLVGSYTKQGKTNSPADVDYRIPRPAGTGVWSVKVVRVTADNALSTKGNDIFFQFATELQDAKLPYNGMAYLGTTLRAETTGSTFPTVAFDTYGLKVRVPSNYTVSTRTYSGVWDGTFKATREWTNNPAWILFDLITNPTYGLGDRVTLADVDQYSFYDAAAYCDGLVPTASGVGTEPRYQFDYQFMEQAEPWTLIQNVAASFGSAVLTSANRVKLVQDRPSNFSRVITNSNVIDGVFDYISSSRSARKSAAIVYWNNPAENLLSVPCYYEDTNATTRYGLSVAEVTALGCTTEGQALRYAKWIVDTSINNLDTVMFKVGLANAGIEVGEVVKLMDTDYASSMNEAKVVSVTASTITLDRAVTVAAGNTFDVVSSDGSTVLTRTVSSTGTLSTLTFSGAALTVSANADVIITGSVSPRLFKITGVKEDSPGVYTVSGVQYDPNKFGRVDNTPTGPAPVYQATTNSLIGDVSNVQFQPIGTSDAEGVRRGVLVTWQKPTLGIAVSYTLRYRRNLGGYVTVENIGLTEYELVNAARGSYEFIISAVNSRGQTSPGVNASYLLDVSSGTGSALNNVTGLRVIGTGGFQFLGPDLNIEWTNPSSNNGTNGTLKDFQVEVYDTTGTSSSGGTTTDTVTVNGDVLVIGGVTVTVTYANPNVFVSGTLLRTEFVGAGTPPGGTCGFSYTFSKNLADGGPRRSLNIKVYARDTGNKITTGTLGSFSNPAPAVPTDIVISGAIGSNKITMTLPTDPDFKGVLVWRGTTSGFTPSSYPNTVAPNGGYIYDGSDNYIADSGVSSGSTYYYRVAAYDTFSKDLSGATLNVSSQIAATATPYPGLPTVSSLPTTGTEGDVILNNADHKLYKYQSGVWVPVVNAGDLYGQLGPGQFAADSVTAGVIAASAVSTRELLAGAVTADKIVANAVTTDKLAADSVSGNKIQGGTITGDKVAANTLTANNIDTRGLSIKDASGTVLLSSGNAPAISTENLVGNPSGDSSTDGWEATVTRTAPHTYLTAQAQNSLYTQNRDNKFGSYFVVAPNQKYFVSFKSIPQGGGTSAYSLNVALAIYDATGSLLSISSITRVATTSGSASTSGTVTVPSNATKAFVYLYLNGSLTSGDLGSSNGYFFRDVIVRRLVSAADASTFIDTGAITNAYIGNVIQSDNFSTGSAGWQLNKSGSVECQNLTARGNIQAATLTVTGQVLTAAAIFIPRYATASTLVNSPTSGSTTLCSTSAVNPSLSGNAGAVQIFVTTEWVAYASDASETGPGAKTGPSFQVLRNGSVLVGAWAPEIGQSSRGCSTRTFFDTPSGSATYSIVIVAGGGGCYGRTLTITAVAT